MPNKAFPLNILLCMLISSCFNYSKKNHLKRIHQLEITTKEDQQTINDLQIKYIEPTLIIAKFNLLKLESMDLDSISAKLIYSEYRPYLNCVNETHSLLGVIEELAQYLHTNSQQVQNLKHDITNSNLKRKDLDLYLADESMYIKNTSLKIESISAEIIDNKNKFDSLNKTIEKIINK